MAHPLTTYRARKGFSQEDLAAELGCSGATVSRWESGKRVPRLRELVRIARVTGIAAAELVKATAAADQ